MEKKFTFYSDQTDVLQSDVIHTLSHSESLESLLGQKTFWLDLNRPTPGDLNYIAEVDCSLSPSIVLYSTFPYCSYSVSIR